MKIKETILLKRSSMWKIPYNTYRNNDVGQNMKQDKKKYEKENISLRSSFWISFSIEGIFDDVMSV